MAAEVNIAVTLDSAAAVADLQALRAAAVASFGGVGAASDAAAAKIVSLSGVVASGLVPIVVAANQAILLAAQSLQAMGQAADQVGAIIDALNGKASGIGATLGAAGTSSSLAPVTGSGGSGTSGDAQQSAESLNAIVVSTQSLINAQAQTVAGAVAYNTELQRTKQLYDEIVEAQRQIASQRESAPASPDARGSAGGNVSGAVESGEHGAGEGAKDAESSLDKFNEKLKQINETQKSLGETWDNVKELFDGAKEWVKRFRELRSGGEEASDGLKDVGDAAKDATDAEGNVGKAAQAAASETTESVGAQEAANVAAATSAEGVATAETAIGAAAEGSAGQLGLFSGAMNTVVGVLSAPLAEGGIGALLLSGGLVTLTAAAAVAAGYFINKDVQTVRETGQDYEKTTEGNEHATRQIASLGSTAARKGRQAQIVYQLSALGEQIDNLQTQRRIASKSGDDTKSFDKDIESASEHEKDLIRQLGAAKKYDAAHPTPWALNRRAGISMYVNDMVGNVGKGNGVAGKQGGDLSDELHKVGINASAAALRDRASGDQRYSEHPIGKDAQGNAQYHQGSILYFPRYKGGKEEYATAYTDPKGVQRIAEYTTSGTGHYHSRDDRTLASVEAQHGGKLQAFNALNVPKGGLKPSATAGAMVLRTSVSPSGDFRDAVVSDEAEAVLREAEGSVEKAKAALDYCLEQYSRTGNQAYLVHAQAAAAILRRKQMEQAQANLQQSNAQAQKSGTQNLAGKAEYAFQTQKGGVIDTEYQRTSQEISDKLHGTPLEQQQHAKDIIGAHLQKQLEEQNATIEALQERLAKGDQSVKTPLLTAIQKRGKTQAEITDNNFAKERLQPGANGGVIDAEESTEQASNVAELAKQIQAANEALRQAIVKSFADTKAELEIEKQLLQIRIDATKDNAKRKPLRQQMLTIDTNIVKAQRGEDVNSLDPAVVKDAPKAFTLGLQTAQARQSEGDDSDQEAVTERRIALLRAEADATDNLGDKIKFLNEAYKQEIAVASSKGLTDDVSRIGIERDRAINAAKFQQSKQGADSALTGVLLNLKATEEQGQEALSKYLALTQDVNATLEEKRGAVSDYLSSLDSLYQAHILGRSAALADLKNLRAELQATLTSDQLKAIQDASSAINRRSRNDEAPVGGEQFWGGLDSDVGKETASYIHDDLRSKSRKGAWNKLGLGLRDSAEGSLEGTAGNIVSNVVGSIGQKLNLGGVFGGLFSKKGQVGAKELGDSDSNPMHVKPVSGLPGTPLAPADPLNSGNPLGLANNGQLDPGAFFRGPEPLSSTGAQPDGAGLFGATSSSSFASLLTQDASTAASNAPPGSMMANLLTPGTSTVGGTSFGRFLAAGAGAAQGQSPAQSVALSVGTNVAEGAINSAVTKTVTATASQTAAQTAGSAAASSAVSAGTTAGIHALSSAVPWIAAASVLSNPAAVKAIADGIATITKAVGTVVVDIGKAEAAVITAWGSAGKSIEDGAADILEGAGKGIHSVISAFTGADAPRITTQTVASMHNDLVVVGSSPLESLGGGKGGGILGAVTGLLGKILHFSEGGVVPGQGRSDTVPAMLTPGEVVLSHNMIDRLSSGRSVPTLQMQAPSIPISNIRAMGSVGSDPETLRLLNRIADKVGSGGNSFHAETHNYGSGEAQSTTTDRASISRLEQLARVVGA